MSGVDRVTRVAVVGGGRAAEHDVSLASAAAVAEGLRAAREQFDVVPLTVGRDGVWRDEELRPLGLAGAVRVLQSCDVVFPALHGTLGEDGTLAALCELAEVPYVGSGTAAGAAAMDKWVTKLVAEAVGVRTARGRLLRAGEDPGPWTGPVVVKPVTAGSSLGVSLVRDPADLPAALAVASAFDERVLVEEFVVGREVCVAVLGRADGSRTVAPVEEVLRDGVFDHEAKYSGRARFVLPAVLDEAVHAALVAAALRVHDALGCRGLVRLDFFLPSDGEEGVVLNEVNSTPGLTEHSAAPLMFAAAGVPHPELLAGLVHDALATPRSWTAEPLGWAG